MEFLREETNEQRPLLNCIFKTHNQELFVESLGGRRLANPLNISRHGQYALGKILKEYLKRIDRDATGLPTVLYPIKAGHSTQMKVIAIRPSVSAGKPTLRKSGVMAEVI